jgi:hypothetical protein
MSSEEASRVKGNEVEQIVEISWEEVVAHLYIEQ